MENLRIYAASYNVGTSNPDQELKDLLTPNEPDKLPDFYILSFQEVKAQPQNMLLDLVFEDSWTNACRKILYTKGYIKVKSLRLQGLLLLIFGLRKHLLNIQEIDSEYTRTGFGGVWGNKGAVSIRLSIYGCSLCFVNSHLSAHDHQLKDRVEDYNSIVKDQNFHVRETAKIFYHDYVFWMGDLNFRLVEEYEQTPEEIERSILKKESKKLFKYDQLRAVMKKGEAFSELTEQDPDFPPTFKFEVGKNAYDYKRRPAWCDRILYCVNSNNYENFTLQVEQLSYKSHPTYTLSDHKPVSAEFIIKVGKLRLPRSVDQVFSDVSKAVATFDKITVWEEGEDNKAIFQISLPIPESNEDWIGLYKENFGSLDDYIVYEYVSTCGTPLPTSDQGPPPLERPTKFEIQFPQLPNRCKGKYCLIYFSQTEDKVVSVLGMSEPFSIMPKEID